MHAGEPQRRRSRQFRVDLGRIEAFASGSGDLVRETGPPLAPQSVLITFGNRVALLSDRISGRPARQGSVLPLILGKVRRLRLLSPPPLLT